MFRIAFSLLLLTHTSVLYLPVFAQHNINSAKLDSLLQALYHNNKAMGSLSISKRDEMLYSRGFGWYGQKKDSQPIMANGNTRYHIGSITKTFTAVMILQLVEEKKLKLSTPLSDFFPEVPNTRKITIKHLLNHHSGLHNFTDDTSYSSWYTAPKTHEEMLHIIVSHKPDFKPGEKGEYSNSNYVLLGYIIEKVTGSSYAAALKNRITDKIGLKNTSCIPIADLEKNEANSFSLIDGKWKQVPETEMSIPGGAGSITSTSADLCMFAQALFTLRLLSAESLKEMTSLTDNYGLGIFRYPYYDQLGYGHAGAIDGFSSFLFYLPGDSVAAAVTLNAANYSHNDILVAALNIYYGKPYQIPAFKHVLLSEKQLKEYEGIYAAPGFPLKITIKQKDGHLTGQATGQGSFDIEAINEREFRFDPAGVVIIFSMETDGKINKFAFSQGGSKFVFNKEK